MILSHKIVHIKSVLNFIKTRNLAFFKRIVLCYAFKHELAWHNLSRPYGRLSRLHTLGLIVLNYIVGNTSRLQRDK